MSTTPEAGDPFYLIGTIEVRRVARMLVTLESSSRSYPQHVVEASDGSRWVLFPRDGTEDGVGFIGRPAVRQDE